MTVPAMSQEDLAKYSAQTVLSEAQGAVNLDLQNTYKDLSASLSTFGNQAITNLTQTGVYNAVKGVTDTIANIVNFIPIIGPILTWLGGFLPLNIIMDTVNAWFGQVQHPDWTFIDYWYNGYDPHNDAQLAQSLSKLGFSNRLASIGPSYLKGGLVPNSGVFSSPPNVSENFKRSADFFMNGTIYSFIGWQKILPHFSPLLYSDETNGNGQGEMFDAIFGDGKGGTVGLRTAMGLYAGGSWPNSDESKNILLPFNTLRNLTINFGQNNPVGKMKVYLALVMAGACKSAWGTIPDSVHRWQDVAQFWNTPMSWSRWDEAQKQIMAGSYNGNVLERLDIAMATLCGGSMNWKMYLNDKERDLVLAGLSNHPNTMGGVQSSPWWIAILIALGLMA